MDQIQNQGPGVCVIPVMVKSFFLTSWSVAATTPAAADYLLLAGCHLPSTVRPPMYLHADDDNDRSEPPTSMTTSNMHKQISKHPVKRKYQYHLGVYLK